MNRPTVMVIEDDTAILRGLCDALEFAGYEVIQCASGAKAAAVALESTIDLVLLDVMLPGRDGFSILQELRKARPTLPIIMVTARGAEDDRVRGLTEGADDYIVKPFSATELLARVEAVLRRSPQRAQPVQSIRCDGCSVDLARREVQLENGRSESLSEREAGILVYLASHCGRAVDRDELLQNVWGLNPRGIDTRTVDMHIARLRDKLGPDATASIIKTVRGKGYMLSEEVHTE